MSCGCLNCDITIPSGSTGATGPQGPAGANGTNGTNGNDGVALIDTIFTRPQTSATSLSEITDIPIDISTVFTSTGDALEYEVYFSYEQVSGTEGGLVQVTLQDGSNTIPLITSSTGTTIGNGLNGVIVEGTIVRTGNSSINHTRWLRSLGDAVYSSPKAIISGNCKNEVYEMVGNPGTINNT